MLSLQVQAPRGVHEAPWYGPDRESVMLAAVDRYGCIVGWETVWSAEDYAPAVRALTDLLNACDPVVSLQLVV